MGMTTESGAMAALMICPVVTMEQHLEPLWLQPPRAQLQREPLWLQPPRAQLQREPQWLQPPRAQLQREPLKPLAKINGEPSIVRGERRRINVTKRGRRKIARKRAATAVKRAEFKFKS